MQATAATTLDEGLAIEAREAKASNAARAAALTLGNDRAD